MQMDKVVGPLVEGSVVQVDKVLQSLQQLLMVDQGLDTLPSAEDAPEMASADPEGAQHVLVDANKGEARVKGIMAPYTLHSAAALLRQPQKLCRVAASLLGFLPKSRPQTHSNSFECQVRQPGNIACFS